MFNKREQPLCEIHFQPPQANQAMNRFVARPWLASLLGQKRLSLFARFIQYDKLTAVPYSVRRRLATGVATAVLLLALSPTPTHAATITITPGAAGLVNDGQCSLAEAIVNANDDFVIHADCPEGSGPDTIVLAGNTYSYAITPPTIASEIIIEGNGATIQIVSGSHPTMRVIQGNLTLRNTTLTHSNSSGMGLYVSASSTAAIHNSIITGNNGGTSAGGIHNNGTLVVQNSTISGNSSSLAGGIYNRSYANATLHNSTISGNTATGSGIGGFLNNRGMVELNHSTVSGNTGRTGGIDNAQGTFFINNSTIANNNAADIYGHGGILNTGGAPMMIRNSTIHGNTAPFLAGGIANNGTSLTINNSTISGNTGGQAGGILNQGTVGITHSTLTGNTATTSGAGGLFSRGVSSTVAMNRTIVAGNVGGPAREIRHTGSPASFMVNNFNVLGHSGLTVGQALVGVSAGANDRTAASDGNVPTPLANILNPTLANNGGPTLTHALVAGSPAINFIAVDGVFCTPGATADQRGGARANGPNAGGSACDSGAVEFDSALTPTAVTWRTFHTVTSNQPVGLWLATLLLSLATLWRRVRGLAAPQP